MELHTTLYVVWKQKTSDLKVIAKEIVQCKM